MHMVDFLPFSSVETTFVASRLLSCTPSPSVKYSKRIEFAHKRANSFLIELTSFQKGNKIILPELSPLESVHILFK